MIRVNDNFCKLPAAYLFSEVARRIEAYKSAHPGVEVVRMGIGDVTRPIASAAIKTMISAVEEQGDSSTFKGYGPEQGYAFLREAICENDYKAKGIDIEPDEIFISDGAKSDTGNIGDIFSTDCIVAVTDPVYPVYVDTNVMAGRAGELGKAGKWSNIVYLPCTSENGFVPAFPDKHVDMVYLCYPNNPTGTTLTKDQLKQWVDWANEKGVLILFDSAYEAFITEDDVPHSIFEIPGAKECAIEFRSFSKTAGFTGLRCAYTVVPKSLYGRTATGDKVSLRDLWNRRQCTKFNGASYIVQRGAAALYTPDGHKELIETIDYYHKNATVLRHGLVSAGFEVFGGVNSPYIWLKTQEGMSSWDFFNWLMEKCAVAGTPGSGFGPSGEGYFRLTAFNTLDNTIEAVERIKNAI